MSGNPTAELSQYMTPLWVAEALVERHFPRLDCADLVLEPSCGRGAFLQALPSAVPAIGIEIDPRLAEAARRSTGRNVITGDFTRLDLQIQPTAIIGNPPFKAEIIDRFLERSHRLLPEQGRVGFLLPAYLFQTARRVSDYSASWSISYELIPRNAFNGRMQVPLLFALFSKDMRKSLIGFALYHETADIQQMAKPYREAIMTTTGSLWCTVCEIALRRLGGEASLSDIYQELERNRPSRTKFWREKIRQTLRVYSRNFQPISTGRYALREAA